VYGFGRGNDGTRYLRVSEVVVIELQLVGYHAQCTVLLKAL
jgi:hypothetical protein